MFKGLGNLASLMKQAQEMQSRLADMQQRLGELRVTGSAGGDMVTVEATGQQKIVACKVEASLFSSGDKEMLEDLIVAATNQALDKAREAATQEMGQLAGGLSLPGLGDALSGLGLGGRPAE